MLSIYTGTLAYIGCTTGLSFDLLARRAFGSKGSLFPSFIIALYSCALGLSNITKVPKRPMVIVAGTFGTLASVWIYEHIVTWLTLLNAILPPIGAIIMIDFFTGRRHYRAEEDDKICVVNIGSIVGIIAGAVVGIYVKDFGITTINSMVTACLCYVIFNCRRLFRNNACK